MGRDHAEHGVRRDRGIDRRAARAQDRQAGRAREVVWRDDRAMAAAGRRDRHPRPAVGHVEAWPASAVRAPTGRSCAPAPELRQRDDRDAEQDERGDEHAVDAEPVGRDPADQRAGDLADREEDRVQAHDRAAIGREALGHVGQQADARPGSPRPARTVRRPRRRLATIATGQYGRPQVVDQRCPAHDEDGSADHAVADDRRPPVAS